jgi:hypothetical protein
MDYNCGFLEVGCGDSCVQFHQGLVRAGVAGAGMSPVRDARW